MPLPVIAGVLRITVSGQCEGGGPWANTWHAENDSLVPWGPEGILAFHDIFKQFYIGPPVGGGLPLVTYMTPGSNVTRFAYTPLDGSSGAFEYPVVAPGTNPNDPLPAQTCEVITIRTLDRGRQNRGRVFLPAISSQQMDGDGHMAPTFVENLLEQLVAVETAIETGGAHLGVGSYGPYVGAGAPHFTPVANFTMDGLFDVQRRRKS